MNRLTGRDIDLPLCRLIVRVGELWLKDDQGGTREDHPPLGPDRASGLPAAAQIAGALPRGKNNCVERFPTVAARQLNLCQLMKRFSA